MYTRIFGRKGDNAYVWSEKCGNKGCDKPPIAAYSTQTVSYYRCKGSSDYSFCSKSCYDEFVNNKMCYLCHYYGDLVRVPEGHMLCTTHPCEGESCFEKYTQERLESKTHNLCDELEFGCYDERFFVIVDHNNQEYKIKEYNSVHDAWKYLWTIAKTQLSSDESKTERKSELKKTKTVHANGKIYRLVDGNTCMNKL